MIHRILHFGEEPLRETSEPVTEFNEEIRRLVADMFETMHEYKGVGLAAPQIGVNKQVAVIDLGEKPLILINPKITKSWGKESCDEGCLSFPGLTEKVQRAKNLIAEATDVDGSTYEIEADGLLARAIQHELDHLEGILFVDRISKARKLQLKHDLELIKQGESLYEDDEEDNNAEDAF